MSFDLIVVGQGFAGLACAAEAAALGLRVAHYEGEFAGGLVVNVNELERFDEAGGLSGMDHAMTQARDNGKAGVANRQAAVSAIRVVGEGAAATFEVTADDGTAAARAVVLATGARLQPLGVPGETEFEGRGVSHCADCDGPMFSDAEVVVAGGGPWALQEALLLARDCAAVHLVHDGARPAVDDETLARVLAEPKIRLHAGTRIAAVLGDAQGMAGVRLQDAGGGARDLPAAGLFPVLGLQPNSDLAPAAVARDAGGHLVVDADGETAVRSLWAVGQVRAGFGGWLADAVADGRRAARAVKARLAG